jgi:hypothetical protein
MYLYLWDHGHVDQYAVALANALLTEDAGESSHVVSQLPVGE